MLNSGYRHRLRQAVLSTGISRLVLLGLRRFLRPETRNTLARMWMRSGHLHLDKAKDLHVEAHRMDPEVSQ